MNSNIGNILTRGKENTIKNIAIGAGVLVYLGMLLYSSVHNYSVLTRGVEGDMVIWALLGVVALEVSAAALPLALHYWCYANSHRYAALTFYAVDILLLVANVVLDYAITAGETLPPWIKIYQFYGAPVVPIIAGLGWSVLFMLDPSQKERTMSEMLKAATREALSVRIAEQAQNADINKAVEQAALEMARAIVRETLGVALTNSGSSAANEIGAGEIGPSQSRQKSATSKNKETNAMLQRVGGVIPLSGNGNGTH